MNTERNTESYIKGRWVATAQLWRSTVLSGSPRKPPNEGKVSTSVVFISMYSWVSPIPEHQTETIAHDIQLPERSARHLLLESDTLI